jgi:hypothetical protein
MCTVKEAAVKAAAQWKDEIKLVMVNLTELVGGGRRSQLQVL